MALQICSTEGGKMPGFDVLDRNCAIDRHCFLEASAGTGKTFTIVTLVVRLLLQKNGPDLNEILVVTFTKAATHELKSRIREKIKETIVELSNERASSDYIVAIQNEGMEAVDFAKKRLQRALDAFEMAKIFTLHSFCFHTLAENPLVGGFTIAKVEDEFESKNAISVIKDHLRVHHGLHPKQWDILLRKHQNDPEKLCKACATLAEKRVPIACGRNFDEISKEFFSRVDSWDVKCQAVLHELLEIAPFYEKMRDPQKKLKKEVVEDLKQFSMLFEGKKEFPFGNILLKMRPDFLLKKTPPQLPLWEKIQQDLLPLLIEAEDEMSLLAQVAEGCRERIEREVASGEVYFFDDLVRTMQKKVREKPFAEMLRGQYKAVFIDEFQDTDQAQWEIFSRLFSKENFSGSLYLIGDPKQSIYRFRNADLYTYMRAKSQFSQKERGDLVVNFRSSGGLVNGLNALFAPIQDFLVLPKTKEAFPCPHIHVKPQCDNVKWKDGRGSIHFFQGEEDEIFSFVVNEIKRLHVEENISLHQFAILVKDRFQAEAFCHFAKQQQLPVVSKRSRSLVDSKAFSALTDFVEAVLNPKEKGKLPKVLAGPLFRWSDEEIKNCDEKILNRFFQYREQLYENGLLSLLQETFSDVKFCKRLFVAEDGLSLYQDLLQLGEVATSEHVKPDSLLSFFSELKRVGNGEERLLARAISSESAVQVMTLHVSKGLEFDVVFPLGLIKHHETKKEIVFDDVKSVLTNDVKAFERHLEELDAEKMRLLYVALTRARKRLYLPLTSEEKKGNSPMAHFLEKLHKPLNEIISTCSDITLSSATNEAYTHVPSDLGSLTPPVKPEFSFPQLMIRSFSSLSQHHPTMEIIVEKDLPAGKEFGQFLHTLFEKVGQNVDQLIERSPYKAWKEKILALMSSALHVPLLHFSLADVDPKKMIRELEFLYPTANGDMMRGFIDLVFEHEGKVYFVDWKSNLLPDYSPPTLELAMHDNDYFLQAKIYREAVERYFSSFQKKFPFGGAFYLFLRGPAVHRIDVY